MPTTKHKTQTAAKRSDVKFDLNDVRLLMQVIEHGSYRGAARAAGIAKSTLSQRIANLETCVGMPLLRRTSRSLSATEAGESLLPYARAIDDIACNAEREFQDRGNSLGGTLRITTSFALAQFALAPVLPEFLKANPAASIIVDVTNQYVDIVQERYDMSLRAHGNSLPDSSLLQRVAAHTPWSLVASPRWIGKFGVPMRPESLSDADTLFFATEKGPASWKLSRADRTITVPLSPRLSSNDMATLCAAAINDGGVASLPDYILAPAIKSKALTPVLPEWSMLISTISILMPPKRQASRLAKAFSEYLVRQLRDTARG